MPGLTAPPPRNGLRRRRLGRHDDAGLGRRSALADAGGAFLRGVQEMAGAEDDARDRADQQHDRDELEREQVVRQEEACPIVAGEPNVSVTFAARRGCRSS